MRWLTRALALAVVVTLAACGQGAEKTPPPPTPSYVVTGTFNANSAPLAPMGATFIMVDSDAIEAAEVVEVIPGLYSTTLVPMQTDGSFELPLPEPEELPAGVLVDATDIFRLGGSLTCELAASPASVKVSQMSSLAEPIITPGIMFVSLLGPIMTIASPIQIDTGDGPPAEGFDMVFWLYADGDVSITAAPEDCVAGTVPLTVDLQLSTGWNQVSMHYGFDPDTGAIASYTFIATDHEELFFNFIGGM